MPNASTASDHDAPAAQTRLFCAPFRRARGAFAAVNNRRSGAAEDWWPGASRRWDLAAASRCPACLPPMRGGHPSSARPVAGQSALRPCPRRCRRGAEPSRTSRRRLAAPAPGRQPRRPGRPRPGGRSCWRAARSQPTRKNGGCDDTQDRGCAAQLKIHSPVPLKDTPGRTATQGPEGPPNGHRRPRLMAQAGQHHSQGLPGGPPQTPHYRGKRASYSPRCIYSR